MLDIQRPMNDSHLPGELPGTKQLRALKLFDDHGISFEEPLCMPGIFALAKHHRVAVGSVSRLSSSEGGSHTESTMLAHLW